MDAFLWFLAFIGVMLVVSLLCAFNDQDPWSWLCIPFLWLRRPGGDKAAVARIVLGLIKRGEIELNQRHQASGLQVGRCGNVTLPNGVEIDLGGWYEERIKRATKAHERRKQDARMLAGTQQLGENVVRFEQRRREA